MVAVALWGGGSAWAQSDPVLVGSSSATSSSAVSSLTLTAPAALYPGDLMIANLSQSYGGGPVTVSLSSVANVAALSNQGTNPSNGGVDTSGYAFDANLVGSSLTWNGITYSLGSGGCTCATANTTVALPAGNFNTLNMLATSVYSGGIGQTVVVTYTDGTTTSFSQSFSDWGIPSSYTGETIVQSSAYRITSYGSSAGATQANPNNPATGWNIYGYSLALNAAKTVKSVTLPATRNVVVMGISLRLSSAGATAPAGWTQLTETSTGAVSQSVWYRTATSADVAGATTYGFAFPTSGRAAGSIMAFGGVATANPVATTASQLNAPSTTYTAPSVTLQSTETAIVLYTIANGTTSGSDFSAVAGTSATVDVGTGSGTSGVLIGGFQSTVSTYCSSSCSSGSISTTSQSSTSAASIGTIVLLNGGTPTPFAQWHSDESSWSGSSGEVADSSGYGFNAVAVGGATTAGVSPALAGSPGTCNYGSFNGSTQYVQLPTTLPHVGNNGTITAWMRPTASVSGGRVFWDDYNYDGFALSFGDPGGNRLRLWYRHPSGGVDSSYTMSLNTWYFVAADFQNSGSSWHVYLYVFSASGTLLGTSSTSGSGTWSAGTGPYATIGGNATGSVEGASYRFPGNIDEVALYDSGLSQADLTTLAQTTHPCTSSVPDHYAVSAASSAINCQATPVTINAHTSAHAAVATTDTITLTTSTGHGDWALSTGSGTFTAGASNSGTATYTYVSSDAGSATFSLRDTTPETVTINVTDGSITAKSGTATSSEDGPITFAPTGFRITNASNVATVVGTQVAGVTSSQSLALQAVRTDTNTGSCTSVFASGTVANVNLAYQCNNPSICVAGQTLSIANNGTSTSLASNPNAGLSSYTTVPLKFTTANGEAPFTLNYTDVGQITLAAKYNLPLQSGAASANNMVGSSQFVVQPYTLKLSNLKATSSGAANPAASTASGSVFLGAGQPFTASVSAINYAGNATPNFGQEASPATVSLMPNLVLPASGHNPSLSGTFGTYSSGTGTGTAFSWPEVGIITLTPAVASYLGSGALTGTTSGNVGRFIPNTFTTALNTPVFGTACAAGGFGYVGQPFGYTVAPVVTVTATAVGGATTQNYTGSLMRLTNSSLTGRAYTPTPASPALTLSGLPATGSDPAIADLGTGLSTLTFSAGSGISFTRGSASSPFSANIALSINVVDLDGASASNPVTFGAGSGIAFSTGANQYYGRLYLRSSLGSELLDLQTPLTTQYYLNATQGFVANTSDVCTAAPTLTFSNYLLNLQSGETCVRDSGNPGSSGQGCAAAASSRYSPVASAGAFNLILAAPGAGNSGALTVAAAAPTWLQYLWNVSSGSNSSPTGMATFGMFPGSPSRVYQREVY